MAQTNRVQRPVTLNSRYNLRISIQVPAKLMTYEDTEDLHSNSGDDSVQSDTDRQPSGTSWTPESKRQKKSFDVGDK